MRLLAVDIGNTNVTMREASSWIWPTKRGISSGFTMPLWMSSALPTMPCRGVFNSWETLAVNSRRLRSAYSCSVTSKVSSTVPTVSPPDWMRLISSWYSRPLRWQRSWLWPSFRAVSRARLSSWLRSTVRKSRPTQPSSA